MAKKCECCNSPICDRCGEALYHSYSWRDCTEEYSCEKCDRKFYTYYAGKPDYKGGSLQKLWFALMKRYWSDD